MRTNLLEDEILETEMNQHGESILDHPTATNPWTLHWTQPKWAGLPRQPLQMHKKLTVTVSSTKLWAWLLLSIIILTDVYCLLIMILRYCLPQISHYCALITHCYIQILYLDLLFITKCMPAAQNSITIYSWMLYFSHQSKISRSDYFWGCFSSSIRDLEGPYSFIYALIGK